MGLKVRKEYADIVHVNQKIINNIKSQKVRADKLFQDYGDVLNKEMMIPANKYMRWTTVVKPYHDAVITSKLLDYELSRQYELFLNEIAEFENQSVQLETEYEEIKFGFDVLVELVQRLESKIIVLKKDREDDLMAEKIHVASLYRNFPEKIRKRFGYCFHCGIKLNKHEGDKDTECLICSKIPKKYKVVDSQDQEMYNPEDEPDDDNTETDGEEESDQNDGESEDESETEESEETEEEQESEQGSDDESEQETETPKEEPKQDMGRKPFVKLTEEEKKDRENNKIYQKLMATTQKYKIIANEPDTPDDAQNGQQ